MNKSISSIRQFGSFFREPVELAHRSESMLLFGNGEQPMRSQSTNDLYSGINDNIPVPKIPEKKKTKKLYIDHIKNPAFYVMIKPEGAKQGLRLCFHYCFPFIGILNSEISEYESIPPSSQIYIKGRFLFILFRGIKRKFSIKSNLEEFITLISKKMSDTLAAFFLSYKAAHFSPPPTHQNLNFYNTCVFNEKFLYLFARVPQESMRQSIIETWVRAADSSFDVIFEKLYRAYFECLEYENLSIPMDEFVFKASIAVFSIDDTFKSFYSNMMKSHTKCIQDHFMNGLEGLFINERTKMLLFILCQVIDDYFPKMKTSLKIIALLIIKAVVCLSKAEFSAEKIEEVESLSRQIISCKTYVINKNFERIISQFKEQTIYFCPPQRGVQTLESFNFLLNYSMEHISDFIEVL